MKLIPQTVTITGAQWAAIITDAEKVAALTELVEERSEALYELGELLPDSWEHRLDAARDAVAYAEVLVRYFTALSDAANSALVDIPDPTEADRG